MDKDEILKKSRREYGITDEREQQEQTFAASVGMWAMVLFATILGLVKSQVFHLPHGDVMAVAFFGAAAMWFAQYCKSRDRRHLVGGIFFTCSVAIFLASYFIDVVG